jgi:hypothetical protein
MVSGISNAMQAQPVSQYAEKPAHKPAQSEPQSGAGADSVQLSSAAQARLAEQQAQKPTTYAAHKGGHKQEAAEKPAAQ